MAKSKAEQSAVELIAEKLQTEPEKVAKATNSVMMKNGIISGPAQRWREGGIPGKLQAVNSVNGYIFGSGLILELGGFVTGLDGLRPSSWILRWRS